MKSELPLSLLQPSQAAVIVQVDSDPRNRSRLTALGLLPGRILTLHRNKPQLIMSLGNTLIGLDQSIADKVLVSVLEDLT